ncbi:MAG: aquaporin family protein [Actinomycetales bacterium]|nr:MAG: aquaporin family protein [Actinomycetales bacterium]
MSAVPLWRRTLAELFGTGALVALVVGSGIMAATLSSDDVGLQLLENSIATGLGLCVLIVLLGPVSGAHLNPVVTLVLAMRQRTDPVDVPAYIGAQIVGGVGGCALANVMFQLPAFAASTTVRSGLPLLLAEVVATSGLVAVILGLLWQGQSSWIPPMVGAYILAAYWFTASTSFANPAVTVGRAFSDTFAGIAPASVPPFVGAQFVGGALGLGVAVLLFTGGALDDDRPAAATPSQAAGMDGALPEATLDPS